MAPRHCVNLPFRQTLLNGILIMLPIALNLNSHKGIPNQAFTILSVNNIDQTTHAYNLNTFNKALIKNRRVELKQWKGINRKQSTRWQHLSQLKASVFFSFQKNLVVMKHSNLYLGLVLPSGG